MNTNLPVKANVIALFGKTVFEPVPVYPDRTPFIVHVGW